MDGVVIIAGQNITSTPTSYIHHITKNPIIFYKNHFLMVKIQSFCGAVFSPQSYPIFLKNNLQHLQKIPMTKTFNTTEMLSSNLLLPDPHPSFYIYKQIYQQHVSIGILCQISVEDYHITKIKKHEKTLHRPHLTYQTYKKEHVGPIVVSYRDEIDIEEMINEKINEIAPYSSWKTIDGRHHTLWKISSSQMLGLPQKFNKIDSLYILDGHHRMQAAYDNYLLTPNKTQKDRWIQALIYSSKYIIVHSQHRIIRSNPQREIIRQLQGIKNIQVKEIQGRKGEGIRVREELKKYEVVMKEGDIFYGIKFKYASRNLLEKMISVRLQGEIFSKILDEISIKEIRYAPGIIEQEEINKEMVVFYVREGKVETIFEIADDNGMMPPKSTWIEPKPCSHMVVRL